MPRSRRQKRPGQRQAVLNDRINKGKCEVWVGNLPRYGMNTNNISLFEWWITVVMKCYPSRPRRRVIKRRQMNITKLGS